MKRNANAARTGSPARGLEPQLPTQEITTWVLFPPRITPRQTEILLHALLAQCYAAPMTLPGSTSRTPTTSRADGHAAGYRTPRCRLRMSSKRSAG
jgi:hypothetical protein